MGAKLEDFENADYAYAPPFSTAIHPFTHTLNILRNKISGSLETITPAEFAAGGAGGYRIVDACVKPSIAGAPYLELTEVEGVVDGLDPNEKILLVCNKGKRAYLLQNRLKYFGYRNTRVLEGGITFNRVEA